MITAFVALIFYVVDPPLGIIMAVVTPPVVALSTDGNYSDLLVLLLFASAMVVFRKLTDRELDGRR